MKIRNVLYILAFLVSAKGVVAINPVTGEISGKNASEVNTLVLENLGKLKSNFKAEDNTKGFAYRYTSPLWNLYQFDIYIGEYTSNSTIIRIEAVDDTNKALLDVFTSSATGIKYPYSYEPKNLWLGHALTFVLPAAGNLYTNTGSVLDMKLSWLWSLLYLGIDGALLWMGGTTFFTHDFDPFGQGIAATLALMGTYRVGHMIFNHVSIVAHNNIIGLGYTFQFK